MKHSKQFDEIKHHQARGAANRGCVDTCSLFQEFHNYFYACGLTFMFYESAFSSKTVQVLQTKYVHRDTRQLRKTS